MAIDIPRHKLNISTSRASGPGGQHVNKTETRVEIRFNVAEADWLPDDVKRRLARQQANRINRDGELILACGRQRSQHANLEECVSRLEDIVETASRPPKKRKRTRPSRASKERRLRKKKRRGQLKKSRSWSPGDER